MCKGYEDFYEETSEFEIDVDRLKKLLYASVKQEIILELQELREENKRLQDVKQRIEEMEREHAQAIQAAEHKAKKMRYDELVKACATIYWKASAEFIKQEKCYRCDANRQIKFISPLGREMKEMCACADTIVRYKAIPQYVSEIRKYIDLVIVWHSPYRSGNDDGYETSVVVRDEWVSDGKTYESIDKYNAYFTSESECKEYCHWLNNMERDKEERKMGSKEDAT